MDATRKHTTEVSSYKHLARPNSYKTQTIYDTPLAEAADISCFARPSKNCHVDNASIRIRKTDDSDIILPNKAYRNKSETPIVLPQSYTDSNTDVDQLISPLKIDQHPPMDFHEINTCYAN